MTTIHDLFTGPPGPPYQGAHLWRVWFNCADGGFDCKEIRADTAEEAAAYLRTFAASCSASAHRAEIVDESAKRIAEIFKPKGQAA